MALITNRLGETKTMNCGMNATIISYRRCDDIDIQFEDGTIVTNKAYDSFKQGSIKNPNCTATQNHKTKHLGETNTSNAGHKMEIIEYKNQSKITIKFIDFNITKTTDYKSFKLGTVALPSDRKPYTERIGEIHTANNGHKLTIIGGKSAQSIDIQFDDGTICKNIPYSDIKAGNIRHPKETRKITNGMILHDSNGIPITVSNKISCQKCYFKYADGTEICTQTNRIPYIKYPKMPKIGYNLRNYKVDKHLFIKNIISTQDFKNKCFVCIFDDKETIWMKNDIIKYFSNIYGLNYQNASKKGEIIMNNIK